MKAPASNKTWNRLIVEMLVAIERNRIVNFSHSFKSLQPDGLRLDALRLADLVHLDGSAYAFGKLGLSAVCR